MTAGARAAGCIRRSGERDRRDGAPGWLWLKGRALTARAQTASSETASPGDAVLLEW